MTSQSRSRKLVMSGADEKSKVLYGINATALLLTAAGIAILAIVANLHLSSRFGEDILVLWDFWFEADIPRVFENLTDRLSEHDRSSVHPLFLFFVGIPTIGLMEIYGISAVLAVQVGMALVSGIMSAAIFFLLFQITNRMLDAIAYTFVFLASGSFIFWFSVPETYAWGGLSMLAVLAVISVTEGRRSLPLYVAANTFSFGMTITNAMCGLAATFFSWPSRHAIRICAYSFALIALLSALQGNIYPSAKFLKLTQELGYMIGRQEPQAADRNQGTTQAGGHLASVPIVFFVNSMVVPELGVVRKRNRGTDTPLLSFQESAMGSGSDTGPAAALAWLALLGLGFWGALGARPIDCFSRVLLATLLGQLTLHLLYGPETFLYSAHFVPLLVLLAAFSSRTPARWPALALALVVTVAGGLNNLEVFGKATNLMHAFILEGVF